MIHPSNPANRIDTTFSVCDIENRDNGEVLSIGFYDGAEYRVFAGWEEWLVFLFSSQDKRHEVVYAHNGSGWDWLSLLEYVCKGDKPYTFDTIQNGNRLVSIMLNDGNRVVRLLDSLFLLQTSLDKAGKVFAGRGKRELKHLPEWYWEHDRPTFYVYLEEDCKVLYETMIGFCNTVFTKVAPIAKLGITLPSTALKVFSTGYLKRTITIPKDDQLRKPLRLAYAGGRVEVFKQGYHPNVNVYDVNSLYPSVMADTLVPISDKVLRTTKPDLDGCGVFLVRYQQRHGIPVLLQRGLGSYRGEGWYFTNELRRLKEVGAFEVLDGFQFRNCEVLFGEFVSDLYRLRMTDKDGALGAVCKLTMNATYGKFGTKPERSRTCKLSFDELYEEIAQGREVETISEEYGVYRITEEKATHCEHVGIAGTITSEARARLWEQLDDSSIYCDTDSIHTPRKLDTSSGLGALKLEFNGEGVYCGKKLYALRNMKEEKVRAKGIRVGGKLGCKLTFSDLHKVAFGSKIVCDFKAPETVNGVMKGKRSCRMIKRTRTVRKTVGMVKTSKAVASQPSLKKPQHSSQLPMRK